MDFMKFIYYGFGAFIGFGCGVIINLIFYWVEQSGHPILTDLIKNYGGVGRFVAEMVKMLPFFGLALGIILVKVMFHKAPDKADGSGDS